MISHYFEAARNGLMNLVAFMNQLIAPLALCAGLLLGVVVLTFLWQRKIEENSQYSDTDKQFKAWLKKLPWRHQLGEGSGYVLSVLFLAIGWTVLSMTRPMAQQDMKWRETAKETTNPAPDAPPVAQSGPALARLTKRTYARTITLPPDLLQRIRTEGSDALAPYLSDASQGSILHQRDVFRRRGRDMIFTRQATQLNEDPMPFSDSLIQVKFHRLAGRAYDTTFDGRYAFENKAEKPATMHFLFNLPEAGTIRDLTVTVGGKAISEKVAADKTGTNTYEWQGEMQPGAKSEAIVHYRVIGTRLWSYDLGSQRRRVQQFNLDASTEGPVSFLRGSLQPTTNSGGTLRWEMGDVVTAQKIAIVIAPDGWEQRLYLQALGALPASFILFPIGILALGVWFRRMPSSYQLLGGLVLFAFGLGAGTVLKIYLGAPIGMAAGPILGAFLVALILGRHSLLISLPLGLLPATFLSAQDTGLMILIITVCTVLAILAASRISFGSMKTPKAPQLAT